MSSYVTDPSRQTALTEATVYEQTAEEKTAPGTLSYQQALEIIDKDVNPEIEVSPPANPQTGEVECQAPPSHETGVAHQDVFFGLPFCEPWCKRNMATCGERFRQWMDDYCEDWKMGHGCECAKAFGFGLELHKGEISKQVHDMLVDQVEPICPGADFESAQEVQSELGLAGGEAATSYYGERKPRIKLKLQLMLLIAIMMGYVFIS